MGGTFAVGARSCFYRMVVPQGGTLALTLDPAPKDGWTMLKVLDRSEKSLGAQQFNAGASGTYEVAVEPGIIYIEAFNESSQSGTAFGLQAALSEN